MTWLPGYLGPQTTDGDPRTGSPGGSGLWGRKLTLLLLEFSVLISIGKVEGNTRLFATSRSEEHQFGLIIIRGSGPKGI
jgi:hypothetical protein